MDRSGGRPAPLDLSPQDAISPQVKLEYLREQLSVQQAIAEGARNFLAVVVVDQENEGGSDELRTEVEAELEGAERQIRDLEMHVARLEQAIAAAVPAPLSPAPPPPSATANGFASYESGAYTPTSIISSGMDALASSGSLPLHGSSSSDNFQPAFDLVMNLLQRLEDMEQVGERIKAMDTVVETLNQHVRVKYELRLEEHLSSIMTCLSEDAGKDIRSATYRLLRHIIVDSSDIYHLHTRHIHLFLVRSLSRDSKHDVEKEQALRLVRAMLEHIDSSAPEHRLAATAIMRAVVAIAEQSEEKLRLAALETLGELVIRDIALLVSCDGLRVVLQALSDGPHDFSPFLSLAFLWVMDRPDTRQWLRAGVDIEIVFSGFTEVQGKGSSSEERVKASASIVGAFLKSWSGLMYLNIHGRQALTSLVDSLTNPSRVIRDTLLDMLFGIFNVRHSSPKPGKLRLALCSIQAKSSSQPEQHKTNLIDQYMAIMLLIFIDAGLVEALAELAADPKDQSTARKVSLLIGEVLDLASRVLPPMHAARVQALPKLFALTSSFDTSDQRLAASSTLLAVTAFDRERRVTKVQLVEDNRPRSNSLEDPSQRNLQQRQHVESAKLRMALSMDDTTFRNLLLETGVLSTKDHTKWAFETLMALLEGPLRNPKRLDEAMRASKFMRRLLGFFQPGAGRYSELRKDQSNLKYTQLGCTTLSTLLANPDGVQYLAEDKLLPQLADCLLQLDAHGPLSHADALLSKDRMETTLVSGYFEMLGTLTKSSSGLALLDHFKFFTCFYHISELRSREDLVRAIIENVDYSRDGHPRVFLHKTLTSSYKHIRLFATRHLATLLLTTAATASPLGRAEEWQIDLLVPQLYDPSPEVTELAVQVLDQACQETETLEMVVRKRPALDHLGDVGVGLLTKFLSTAVGVRYLHEIDFIERELEDWYDEQNFRYMIQLELSLAAVLKVDGGALASTTFDGTPPPHFYGELVKTQEGCEILDESGHFTRFAEIIREHAERELDSEFVAQLKSVLWAVGHIGSSERGLPFLDDEFILTDMVEIASTSPVYSLRGTAVFALALISSTVEGVEMLEELGWESVCTPLNGPTGLCIPMDLADLVYTPLWPAPELALPESLSLAPPTSHVEREALVALANLSNHILATKASKTLAKLKARHRSLFALPALYYRALEMLASHHYRLPVRKYIVELFELPMGVRNAERVVQAGEELRAKKDKGMATPRLDGEGEEAAKGGEGATSGFKTPAWAASGVSALVNGIEGDVTDDDDESSVDEAELILPVKTLTPLLTVKGFLLA
ncbi:hypothetical protein JCM1841_006247 [Sporobolomyces salmonicolor]